MTATPPPLGQAHARGGEGVPLFPDAQPGVEVPHSLRQLRGHQWAEWRARHSLLTWIWGALLALCVPVLLFVGAAQGVGGALMLLGLAAGVWALATRHAGHQFFAAYGAARGLHVVEDGARIAADVPLLRKGDKRAFDRVLSGRVADTSAALAHYTYTVVTTDSEGRRCETDYDFTLVHFRLPEQVATRFRGVYCRARSLSLGGLQDKLSHDRGVELESADFRRRYTLRVLDRQQDIALYELFSTTFIDQLSGRHFTVGGRCVQWEQVEGDLLVFVKDHVSVAGQLDELVAHAAVIERRYREEYM